jgi:hypothetical protein
VYNRWSKRTDLRVIRACCPSMTMHWSTMENPLPTCRYPAEGWGRDRKFHTRLISRGYL